MLISSMSDSWAPRKTLEMMAAFRAEFECFTGRTIDDDALRGSIAAQNANRRLLRHLFDERQAGRADFTPVQLRDFVMSSMIMDPSEHTALLRDIIAAAPRGERDRRVRVHLSGHFCHAPKAELLQLIQDCGALVVDDDLYHGRRYVSTDVEEDGDPIEALARWYAQRNVNIPCPTRVQHDVNWDDYLLRSVAASHAEGVIVLMAKFCEPHMLYYPQLRQAFDAAGIPHVLIETEHEGMPLESIRTRIEALVERIRRHRSVAV